MCSETRQASAAILYRGVRNRIAKESTTVSDPISAELRVELLGSQTTHGTSVRCQSASVRQTIPAVRTPFDTRDAKSHAVHSAKS